MSPIYMPGRLRTASRPLRTLIEFGIVVGGDSAGGFGHAICLESAKRNLRENQRLIWHEKRHAVQPKVTALIC